MNPNNGLPPLNPQLRVSPMPAPRSPRNATRPTGPLPLGPGHGNTMPASPYHPRPSTNPSQDSFAFPDVDDHLSFLDGLVNGNGMDDGCFDVSTRIRHNLDVGQHNRDSFDTEGTADEGIEETDIRGSGHNDSGVIDGSPIRDGPEETRPSSTAPPLSVPASARDVVLRLRVEKLAKDCGLIDWQKQTLMTAAMIPSELNEEIPLSYILLQVCSVGAVFQCFNRTVDDDDVLSGYRGVLKQMNHSLDKAFKLTRDQESDIRDWVRYKLWDPYRLDHRARLVDDVFLHITNNAEALGFGNIQNIPHRLNELKREIGDKARSIKNGLRQKIRNSVDPEDPTRLTIFLRLHRNSYMFPGCQGYSDEHVTLKIVLMRRFMVDNPDMVWGDVKGDGEGGGSSTLAAGGRVPKGADFWTKFDEFVNANVARLGKQIKSPPWRTYFAELCKYDNDGFPGRVTLASSSTKKRRKIKQTEQEDEVTSSPQPVAAVSTANPVVHMSWFNPAVHPVPSTYPVPSALPVEARSVAGQAPVGSANGRGFMNTVL
ncbi:hypothetical protein PQX77_008156 [Marasmius sp. AFHP31]|nr:hypothetical protein PQX77_008156 [Marasmius sp. AFHP31]